MFFIGDLTLKIYLYVAPKATGDINAKQWLSGFDVNNINDACEFDVKRVELLKPDI